MIAGRGSWFVGSFATWNVRLLGRRLLRLRGVARLRLQHGRRGRLLLLLALVGGVAVRLRPGGRCGDGRARRSRRIGRRLGRGGSASAGAASACAAAGGDGLRGRGVLHRRSCCATGGLAVGRPRHRLLAELSGRRLDRGEGGVRVRLGASVRGRGFDPRLLQHGLSRVGDRSSLRPAGAGADEPGFGRRASVAVASPDRPRASGRGLGRDGLVRGRVGLVAAAVCGLVARAFRRRWSGRRLRGSGFR